MLFVPILSTLIHVYIVTKAVAFFRTTGHCRESDKHMVAAIATLSVLFIVSQSLMWLETPPQLNTQQLSGPMFLAYNFSVAILFLAQIQLVTDNRGGSCQRR